MPYVNPYILGYNPYTLGNRVPYNTIFGGPQAAIGSGQFGIGAGTSPLALGAAPPSLTQQLGSTAASSPSFNGNVGATAEQLALDAGPTGTFGGARMGAGAFGAAAAEAPAAAVPWTQLLLKGQEGAAGLAGKGLLARGGLGILGGTLAQGVTKEATGSDLLGSIAGGGAAGAIIGAPLGGIGAVPGWAVGALAGGTLGVLNQELNLGLEDIPVIGGIFGSSGGGEAPSIETQNRKMRHAIERLSGQLAPPGPANIQSTIEVIRAMPKEQRAQAYAGLLQTLPDAIAQSRQQQATLQKQLAIQMQVAQAMAGLSKSSSDLGYTSAATIRGLIPSVDPRLAPILEYDAAQRESWGQQAAQAYQGAALAQPTVDAFQSQIAQLNQINQQMQAQGGSTQSLAGQLGYGG